MYLKRKIDTYLMDWKNSENRKPLIVKGPRQIGKTESIKKFAQDNYKSVIEINFVTSGKYKQITADGYSAEAVIKNISLIDPSHKFIPGETLIFFDEIQESAPHLRQHPHQSGCAAAECIDLPRSLRPVHNCGYQKSL